MKVLLTGSRGFIGSHFGATLVEQGHSVTRVDKKRDARMFFREWDSPTRRYDLVIHCAAVVGGRVLIETPLAHAENLEIDAALFQWAERAKPGRVVYVSSVAAYPKHLQMGAHHLVSADLRVRPDYDIPAHILRERDIKLDDPAAPDELYGWAKLTGEYLASRSSVPVSVPRLFTVYGPGQDPIFPFANIINQIRGRNDPVTVWGSGGQIRDFVHVDDVVDGILEMAKQEVNGPVNFCTGRPVSLIELIRMASNQAGYIPAIKKFPDKPEGLPFRVGHPKLLNTFYTPRVTLEEGIKRGLT